MYQCAFSLEEPVHGLGWAGVLGTLIPLANPMSGVQPCPGTPTFSIHPRLPSSSLGLSLLLPGLSFPIVQRSVGQGTAKTCIQPGGGPESQFRAGCCGRQEPRLCSSKGRGTTTALSPSALCQGKGVHLTSLCGQTEEGQLPRVTKAQPLLEGDRCGAGESSGSLASTGNVTSESPWWIRGCIPGM